MITKHPTGVLNLTRIGPSNPHYLGLIDLTPRTDFSWADEITWTIIVHQVNGAPSGGAITAKFQFGTLYTISASSQFGGNILRDLEPSQIANCIVEQEDWPSPLAAFDLSAPVVWQRTVRNFGSLCNLQLDTRTLAGGTTPTFSVSVASAAKGG